MPHVTHYQLAQVAGTKWLWDAEVAAFVAKITETPADRTALGVFADWLDDHAEPELAQAARFLAKSRGGKLMAGFGKQSSWWISDLPVAVSNEPAPGRQAYDTPLGALAALYFKLDAARKSLE